MVFNFDPILTTLANSEFFPEGFAMKSQPGWGAWPGKLTDAPADASTNWISIQRFVQIRSGSGLPGAR
jgi:hypothetical protein